MHGKPCPEVQVLCSGALSAAALSQVLPFSLSATFLPHRSQTKPFRHNPHNWWRQMVLKASFRRPCLVGVPRVNYFTLIDGMHFEHVFHVLAVFLIHKNTLAVTVWSLIEQRYPRKSNLPLQILFSKWVIKWGEKLAPFALFLNDFDKIGYMRLPKIQNKSGAKPGEYSRGFINFCCEFFFLWDCVFHFWTPRCFCLKMHSKIFIWNEPKICTWYCSFMVECSRSFPWHLFQ